MIETNRSIADRITSSPWRSNDSPTQAKTPPIERIKDTMEAEGSGQDPGEPRQAQKMPRRSLN